MAKKESRLEELLKQNETVSNDALKAAIGRQIEVEKKKEEEELFNALTYSSSQMKALVEKHRALKARIKTSESNIKELDSAIEEFKTSGDINKLIEAIRTSDVKRHQY